MEPSYGSSLFLIISSIASGSGSLTTDTGRKGELLCLNYFSM